MDSPQSVISPLEISSKSTLVKPRNLYSERSDDANSGGFVGAIDVHVHQARDIHNICIYHKQDVYAKLSLSTDPDAAVSTKTVNGGGRNPVFDEILRLHITAADSSVRCEVWMMSRARNYLEDQLLGVASLPLSEIISRNGRSSKNITLSSSDMMHSPSGFLQLSFSYNGDSIEGINPAVTEKSSESEASLCDYNMIEFPDPKIVKENQIMVKEYTGVDCSESFVSSSDLDEANSEIGVQLVECFASGKAEKQKSSSCPSSPLSEDKSSSSPVLSSTTESSLTSRWGESNGGVEEDGRKPLPILDVDLKMQRDIVDLYMKSMQQFTDSLARMKLPMDLQGCRSPSDDSNSSSSIEKMVKAPNKSGNGRVFYGSRAFF